jgi:hypothetical protein
LLSACATVAPTGKPSLRAKLEALPRCEAGANVGALTVTAHICTKKHCESACCNACSWRATFEGKNGQPTPVDAAQVQSLLGVTESALDCEIAGWADALGGQSLSLEAPACVVR